VVLVEAPKIRRKWRLRRSEQVKITGREKVGGNRWEGNRVVLYK
jgi:hypothetical protein